MFLNEKGSALVMVMMLTIILTILGTSVLAVTMSEYSMEKAYRDSVMAYYLAEAGMEKAIYTIAEMENIDGLDSKTWEMDADERAELLRPESRGSYTVSIEDIQLKDVIYLDDEQTIEYKRIYEMVLKSRASMEGMTVEIAAGIIVEDFNAGEIENNVEISYWHKLR